MEREDIVLLAAMDAKLDTLIERGTDHETRLRSLEKGRWVQAGGVGVIAFIASKLGLPHISVG